MNSTKKTNKFARFLKNNVALLLIIFCVIAITTVVLCVTLIKPDKKVIDNPVVVDPTPDDPVVDKPAEPELIKVYFSAPVKYSAVTMEYNTGTGDDLFVFNKTLGRYETHRAVDLKADEGASVSAMYDGIVIDVTSSYGMGKTVKIDHGSGVIATYSSLADVNVTKGAQVKKGDEIGTVGSTAQYECEDGAHLHLEVRQNDKAVDPMPYINGTVYREVEKK